MRGRGAIYLMTASHSSGVPGAPWRSLDTTIEVPAREPSPHDRVAGTRRKSGAIVTVLRRRSLTTT